MSTVSAMSDRQRIAALEALTDPCTQSFCKDGYLLNPLHPTTHIPTPEPGGGFSKTVCKTCDGLGRVPRATPQTEPENDLTDRLFEALEYITEDEDTGASRLRILRYPEPFEGWAGVLFWDDDIDNQCNLEEAALSYLEKRSVGSWEESEVKP